MPFKKREHKPNNAGIVVHKSHLVSKAVLYLKVYFITNNIYNREYRGGISIKLNKTFFILSQKLA